MSIDRHTLAIISITGSSLDVLGGLYLAYDLLGGEHGPLRTLSRGVTYGLLFAIGYGIPLGTVFGITNGVAHGITLAWEFARAAKHKPKPGILYDIVMSGIRGIGFALGAGYLYGPIFGAMFGTISTVGQVIAYRFGVRPTIDYKPEARPRLTKFQLLASVNRAVGYAATGYVSALVAHDRQIALRFGLTTGLAVGVVTAIVVGSSSFIEWGADHLPGRLMGVLGVGLILVGFALQSVQYWLVLMDVGIR